MSSSDTAICAEHVSKEYRLGVLGSTTLKAEIQTRWALARGRDDPNTKIGQEGNVRGRILYALDDVSFRVKKGERLGIIGQNGAGKSTLLKLICQITTPTSGFIGRNGRVASMLEVGMGFNGELTGRENIYMSGSILGMSKKEIDARFDEIVAFSELGKFIDTPLKRYSSGMAVRLGFSVSAHLNAEIVIMDEVLAVGDVSFQEKCIERMRQISQNENKTILYVSHNMFTIHALCDRCLVLDSGKLVYDGDPVTAEKIYRRQSVSAEIKNLKNEQRIGSATADKVTFLEASFPYEGYRPADTCDLKLKWRLNEPLHGVHLRIELWDTMGHPAGAGVFYDVDMGRPGEVKEEIFSLDTSRLYNGAYRAVYTFFKISDTRENLSYDSVRGQVFKIYDPKREERFVWHRDWWGCSIL